jgi:uncharacterized lipoprotein YehR (DUF1307 family)
MAKATEVGKKLLELASGLRAIGSKNRFSDHWGWQAAPLNGDDLAAMAEGLSEKFCSLTTVAVPSDLQTELDRLHESIEISRVNNVPNLYGGIQGGEAIISLFYALEALLYRLSPDADLRLIGSLSLKLKNRATQAIHRVDEAFGSIEGIEEKIADIQRAHDAAEELPVTQKQLADALATIEKQQRSLSKLEAAATNSAEQAKSEHEKILEIASSAETYLKKISGAYRAVTSQGLAQAFKQQQDALTQSMLVWVFLLLASLAVGGFIAHERFPQVATALAGKPDWGIVVVHLALAILSLSPPVWFAWVATMQIGQRFRLAEDYGYKAAISAAYEGYRAEAARLDPLLEAQLFASALGRLDELPLRLIDSHVPGSPFHEFLRSVEFKKAAEVVPGLADRAEALLRRIATTATKPAEPAKVKDDKPEGE